MKESALNMWHQQFFVLKLAIAVVFTFIIAIIMLGWSSYNPYVAGVNTIIYVTGMVCMIKYGVKVHNLFVAEGYIEITEGQESEVKDRKIRFTKIAKDVLEGTHHREQKEREEQEDYIDQIKRKKQEFQNIYNMKRRSILWLRDKVENGGLFKVSHIINLLSTKSSYMI